jgi:hypothetical protein
MRSGRGRSARFPNGSMIVAADARDLPEDPGALGRLLEERSVRNRQWSLPCRRAVTRWR